MEKPLATVACLTFNHKKYIRQTIEGFLMQQTDFPIEIIIHDDNSTDGTTQIVQEYADQYPELIFPIFQRENQYSKGKKPLINFVFPQAKGKYIALCEGDDYWNDPLKLQKQVEFLEANPDYVISYHNAMIVDEVGNIVDYSKLPENLKKDLSSEELIQGTMILTLTMCFRNVLKDFPDEFFKVYNGDKFLTSLLGHFGKGKYMPEIAEAVYRKHSSAVWSTLDKITQQFNNGDTRAWLYRYYKRTGQDKHADYFKEEAIKCFKRTLRMIVTECSSQHENIIRRIFSDYPDIIVGASEKSLYKILNSADYVLAKNKEHNPFTSASDKNAGNGSQDHLHAGDSAESACKEGCIIVKGESIIPEHNGTDCSNITGLLLMSNLIKTHQPSMEDTFKINWLLTRRCNYKCTYCSVKDNINGYFHDIGSLKTAVDKLSSIRKERLKFSITGGEPTIHPNYLDFLKHIFCTFGDRVYVATVTNLSMPLSFFEKMRSLLADYLEKIHFTTSYHYEFTHKDRFLKNVRYLVHNGISVTVQILAHPEYMDIMKEIYDSLSIIGSDKLAIDVKIIRNKLGSPDEKYTTQDLEWLKKYYKESEIKEMVVEILTHDQRLESLKLSANELIAHNKNSFKGFKCYAGIESICINHNGDIDPAVCFRKTKGKKPNIFRDEDPVGFFLEPLICPFDKCDCLFDLLLSKRHPDYTKLVQLCDPKDNHSLEFWLDSKGWQNKKNRYSSCFEFVDFCNTVESPAVSIVVISWRLHPDNLRNFQILEKQRDQNYELIFVDNGGEPGEFEQLKPFVDTYVRLNTNTGAYLARNVGAVFARAPILIFLEDDGIPEHDFVEAHLRMHRKYNVIAVRGVYSPKTDTPLNKMATHYYLGDLPYPYPSNLEGNCSYRSDIFYAVGGWDDDIVFGHGGRELAIRLLGKEPDQRKQIYSPDPVIYHDFATSEAHLAEKRRKQESSLQRLKKKHPHWDAVMNSWRKYTRRYDLLISKDTPYNISEIERFMGEGKHTETITRLRGILSERPHDASVHNLMGLVHLRRGDKESALGHFQAAVRLEPQNPTYQKNLAGVYIDLQRLKEAVDIYQRVTQAYPEDTDSLMALASFCKLVGRPGDAMQFWEAAVRVDPENAVAVRGLLESDRYRFDYKRNTESRLGTDTDMKAIGKGRLSEALKAYEEGRVDEAGRFLEDYIHRLKDATV